MSTHRMAKSHARGKTRPSARRGDLHHSRSLSRRTCRLFLYSSLQAVVVASALFAQPPPGVPSSRQPQTALDSGLVAWYPFDGNARDASGNGNHGTVDGLEPAEDRNGSPSSALRFVRQDGLVELPYSSDFSFSDFHAVSVGLWFRLLSDMTYRGFSFGFGKGGSICRYFGLSVGVNGMTPFSLVFASECVIAARASTLAAGRRWYHLVATVDDEALLLYLDGVLVAMRGVYDMKWDSPAMVKPRLDRPPPRIPEGIAVDDLRVYRRVLSAQEVMALYNKGTE